MATVTSPMPASPPLATTWYHSWLAATDSVQP